MTYADFKTHLHALGIQDMDHVIDLYIDWHSLGAEETIEVNRSVSTDWPTPGVPTPTVSIVLHYPKGEYI